MIYDSGQLWFIPLLYIITQSHSVLYDMIHQEILSWPNTTTSLTLTLSSPVLDLPRSGSGLYAQHKGGWQDICSQSLWKATVMMLCCSSKIADFFYSRRPYVLSLCFLTWTRWQAMSVLNQLLCCHAYSASIAYICRRCWHARREDGRSLTACWGVLTARAIVMGSADREASTTLLSSRIHLMHNTKVWPSPYLIPVTKWYTLCEKHVAGFQSIILNLHW